MRGAGSIRVGWLVAAGAALVSMVAVAALPTHGRMIIGGTATPLGIPDEPSVQDAGVYLVMTAKIRPVTFGEALLGRTGERAAASTGKDGRAGSMDESKVRAWQASLRALGGSFLVAALDPGGAAERAGFIAGDLISSIDDGPVSLQHWSDQLSLGRTVRIRVLRAGTPLDLDMTADAAGSPLLGGLVLSGTSPLLSPPPLGTGRARGPSAGLLLALAEVDLLTAGSLTGGHIVAATGEILPWGDVASVGAYREKTAAAARAGAEIFIVPTDDAAVIASMAPPGLEVIGVRDLAEAIDALCQRGGQSSLCSPAPSPS